MPSVSIISVVLFLMAVVGVVSVIIYNSLRGVRVTREAMVAYFGVLALIVIVALAIAFLGNGWW